MNKLFKYLSLILMGCTAIILIGLQIKPLGFITFAFGVLSLVKCSAKFRKDIVFIYISLGLLGITPISTSIDTSHMLIMGLLLTAAIAISYLGSRFVAKTHFVQFHFNFHRKWNSLEIFYVLLTILIAYLVFPFALRATGSYHNWTVSPGVANLTLLFIGTNMLGIWDELFFVNSVLGILRKHLPFAAANLLQGILFTSFLYDLGFRGWLFLVIYGFALLQGFIYKKTDSLFYIIVIHLL